MRRSRSLLTASASCGHICMLHAYSSIRLEFRRPRSGSAANPGCVSEAVRTSTHADYSYGLHMSSLRRYSIGSVFIELGWRDADPNSLRDASCRSNSRCMGRQCRARAMLALAVGRPIHGRVGHLPYSEALEGHGGLEPTEFAQNSCPCEGRTNVAWVARHAWTAPCA